MKAVTTNMTTHLQQDVTTLCSCWMILRTDGAWFYFTDHDDDVSFGGNTYVSSGGYNRTAFKFESSTAVDNVDVTGILMDSAGITERDLKVGLFDYAYVKVFVVNWKNPDYYGAINMIRGNFGEVVVTPQGIFRAELRGLTQLLSQEFGNVYSPKCRVDLGSAKCGVAIPAYTATVTSVGSPATKVFTVDTSPNTGVGTGATIMFWFTANTVPASSCQIPQGASIAVTDGTHNQTIVWPVAYNMKDSASFLFSKLAYFTSLGQLNGVAQQSTQFAVNLTLNSGATGTPSAQASGIPAGRLNISGWEDKGMTGGLVAFTSGANNGRRMEIKSLAAGTNECRLWLSLPFPVAVGDTLVLSAGCDGTRETCYHRFNNILNFRGTPDIPGMDKLMYVPDAT